MRIHQIVWLNEFVDKIVRKHDVSRSEVEQLFLNLRSADTFAVKIFTGRLDKLTAVAI